MIGFIALSAFDGIEVLDIESEGADDRIVYRLTGEGRTRKAKLRIGPQATSFRTPYGRMNIDLIQRCY